ncbi:MAG: hypothetical protein L0H73_07865 [Nitrococcus sp.]|nr:hypothetical protein [Nitrococcus sp.]
MWNWLKNPENRNVLTWLGSGLAVVAAALWAVFTYLQPVNSGDSRSKVQVEQGVGAGGDISVGGDLKVSGQDTTEPAD